MLVCGISVGLIFTALPSSPAQGAEKVIYMQAMEPKGGVTVDKEPFPGVDLPKGGGYVIKKPDAKGRWEVSTYAWNPAQIIVRKGDKVTLKIIGINGAKHSGFIEHYHPKEFTVKRGVITTVSFTADKGGRFRIGCDEHKPSMEGELIVLDN
ncbi:MAG: hypothetical protein A3G25_15555 [Betaproteobacteria bacterium RIFCSPLOWO2_12_FULL_63_13]|nr:MAG: hypothetical protein A3G25_15555 [Betaproteobacteria bacterium RIFCSPLOWO2_12_FULL_63_13]